MDKQLTLTQRRGRHGGKDANMSGVTKTIVKVAPSHGSRIRALKLSSKGKRSRSQLTF